METRSALSVAVPYNIFRRKVDMKFHLKSRSDKVDANLDVKLCIEKITVLEKGISVVEQRIYCEGILIPIPFLVPRPRLP